MSDKFRLNMERSYTQGRVEAYQPSTFQRSPGLWGAPLLFLRNREIKNQRKNKMGEKKRKKKRKEKPIGACKGLLESQRLFEK